MQFTGRCRLILFSIFLAALAGQYDRRAFAGTETNLMGTNCLRIELRSLESTNKAWLRWNIVLSNSEPQAVLVSTAAVRSMLCATTLEDGNGNIWRVKASNGTNVQSTMGKDNYMLIRQYKTFETSIDTDGIDVKLAGSGGANVTQKTFAVRYSIDAFVKTFDFTSRQPSNRRCIGKGAVDLPAASRNR